MEIPVYEAEESPCRAYVIQRRTKETRISVDLCLEGGEIRISTGIGFFDHMLTAFASYGGLGLKIEAEGDLEVDGHHTVEDTGIVRNRRKILAAIQNAKVFLSIQEEFGFFDSYLWGFTGGQVILNTDDTPHTHTELSDRISKDLKRRGMNFVGTTIIYSFLQATGVVNDHELACFCHPGNWSIPQNNNEVPSMEPR